MTSRPSVTKQRCWSQRSTSGYDAWSQHGLFALCDSALRGAVVPRAISRSWGEFASSQIDQSLRQLNKWSSGDMFRTTQEAGRTLLQLGPGRYFVSADATAGFDPTSRLHNGAQEYLSLFDAEVVEQDGGTAAHQRVGAEILLQLRPTRGPQFRRQLRTDSRCFDEENSERHVIGPEHRVTENHRHCPAQRAPPQPITSSTDHGSSERSSAPFGPPGLERRPALSQQAPAGGGASPPPGRPAAVAGRPGPRIHLRTELH